MADSSQHFVSYAISWASIALLYYDYLLTFPLEVEYIWGRHSILNSGTLLYVLCRYALVANILYLLGASGKLMVSCDTWHILTATLGVFGRAAVIVTFTRRAYAMCVQNKRVLVFLSTLGIATVVTDAVNVSHQGCKASSSSDLIPTIRSLLTIIFETSATILVTWRSIRTFLTQERQWGFYSATVEYFVFEQGLLYFCLISLLTFATFVLKLRGTSDFAQNLLDALTLPLSGMLTARFILHLRAWDHDHSIIVDSNCSTTLRVDLQQGTSTSVSIPLDRLSFGRNRELDPDQEWNEETEPAHCQDGTQSLSDK